MNSGMIYTCLFLDYNDILACIICWHRWITAQLGKDVVSYTVTLLPKAILCKLHFQVTFSIFKCILPKKG